MIWSFAAPSFVCDDGEYHCDASTPDRRRNLPLKQADMISRRRTVNTESLMCELRRKRSENWQAHGTGTASGGHLPSAILVPVFSRVGGQVELANCFMTNQFLRTIGKNERA